MGEEKPSVPWVLEDYETSQVGINSIQNDVELFERKKIENNFLLRRQSLFSQICKWHIMPTP